MVQRLDLRFGVPHEVLVALALVRHISIVAHLNTAEDTLGSEMRDSLATLS